MRIAGRAGGNPRPDAALKMTPGAFDAVEGGHPTFPLIATPPGQGAAARAAFAQAQGSSYAWIYRTQPAVRKVVDYIARNGAQIGVKLYERQGDDDRHPVRDHPAVESLRRPNGRQNGRRFMYGLLADFLIYENAYAVKFRPRGTERIAFMRAPVWAVEVLGATTFMPTGYRLHLRDGTQREFAPEDVLHLSGYDPDNPGAGVSRLETLRQIMAEEATNQAANVERLKHGGLGPGYIKRPLDAPEWSDNARGRFEEDWAGRARGQGKSSGERIDPVLEEGMEFIESSVTPRDAQMLEGRRFTRSEVASLYGLPAVLVEAGAKEGDRKEARTQFYADCLPPILGPIADDLNLQVLEEEFGGDDLYFEFDLAEKLRGQIEERFKVLVSAAGGPILTRNEARRRENLPDIEGGDDLITPLNVTQGGKPSPGVMGPQDPNGPDQDGSERDATVPTVPNRAQARVDAAELLERRNAQQRRRDRYAGEHRDLLRSTFDRQRRSFKSSGKFDRERWDAELADDLEAQALATVEREGGVAAARLGLADFDLDACRNYLRRGAEERAKAINSTTANRIDPPPDDGTSAAKVDEDDDPFADSDDRAEQAGLAIATSHSAFSHLEAAKQSPVPRVKTWIVTAGGNSRHPDLNGETVPVFETFSNGGQMPGDPKLSADDNAGCKCLLEVS